MTIPRIIGFVLFLLPLGLTLAVAALWEEFRLVSLLMMAAVGIAQTALYLFAFAHGRLAREDEMLEAATKAGEKTLREFKDAIRNS